MIEKIVYKIGKYLIAVYCFFAFDFNIKKYGKLPRGPKIFVANHPSTTDPFLMLILFKEQVSILIGEELFKLSVFGKLLKLSGQIPVIKGNGLLALEKARTLQTLKKRNIVIFIEGSISLEDQSLQRPKTGAVRLALATGAPIIPIGFSLNKSNIKLIKTKVDNKYEIGEWYLTGPYSITIGKPLYLKGNIEDHEHVRQSSMQVMENINSLAEISRKRIVSKLKPGVIPLGIIKSQQVRMKYFPVFNQLVFILCCFVRIIYTTPL